MAFEFDTHAEATQYAERRLLSNLTWQHYAVTFVTKEGKYDYLITDSVNGATNRVHELGGEPIKVGERIWVPAPDHSVPNYTGYHDVTWRTI